MASSGEPQEEGAAVSREPTWEEAVEELAGRGCTLRQLLEFYAVKDIGDMSSADVVRDVVIPETCRTAARPRTPPDDS